MADEATPRGDGAQPDSAPQDEGGMTGGGASLVQSKPLPPSEGDTLGKAPTSGGAPDNELAPRFTHLTEAGEAHMVDVTAKSITVREATAVASVRCSEHIMQALREGTVPKGDVLAVARLAGIQAAKRVPELLPLAHSIEIHGAEVDLQLQRDRVDVAATVRTAGRTGVEMEALTAANVAALAVIDMVKGVDRSAEIIECKIIYKSGGRSGTWYRPGYEPQSGAGEVELVGVIVLAGGTGMRLGGVSKPDVVVGGQRILDLALAEVRRACIAVAEGGAGAAGAMPLAETAPDIEEGAHSSTPPPGIGKTLPSIKEAAGGFSGDKAADTTERDSAGVILPEIVVVAPDGVALPPHTHRALEDPPLGGPVAGLAAGLAELNRHLRKRSPRDYPIQASDGGSSAAMPTAPASTTRDAPEKRRRAAGTPRRAVVALLTCDAPLAPRLYPELLRQLAAHPRAAGAVPVSGEVINRAASDIRERPDGRTFRQYLNGVYGAEELADALRGETRNSSARALFADLPIIEVPDTDNVSMDVDTWDDAADLERRLTER